MSALDELKSRWAHKRFQRAMLQYQAAMEPYQAKMESDSGQLALVLFSGIAQLVALEQESPAALADTIKQASILSGIPEDALEAHARFSSEMITCFEFDQQQNKKANGRDEQHN